MLDGLKKLFKTDRLFFFNKQISLCIDEYLSVVFCGAGEFSIGVLEENFSLSFDVSMY